MDASDAVGGKSSSKRGYAVVDSAASKTKDAKGRGCWHSRQ
jgi:hypothetical protein